MALILCVPVETQRDTEAQAQIGCGGKKGEWPAMVPQDEYIDRALTRLFDRQRAELEGSIQALRAKLAAGGSFKSGGHLKLAVKEYHRILKEGASKAARLAFDTAGATGLDSYQKNLRLFRADLAVEWTNYLEGLGDWISHAKHQVIDTFHHESVDLTTSYIDDFAHGMLEGRKMASDPVLTVTNSILNSPGAVQQGGTGNVQNAIVSMESVSGIQSALAEFLNSREVAGLSDENRQSLFDLSELMTNEIAKPEPDPSRMVRFGRYLLSAADRLGVAVAGQAISKILFG